TDREFTVETCPEPDPEPINAPSPTQDGQNVTIKSVDGVAYVDQNSNTLTGVYVLEDGETITITPVATTDRPVTGGPWTFTWNAPAEPDPVAPVVDAQLIGLLTDGNESAVDATVTVVHNDATGPVTVILSNGDDVLWTQVFPEEQVEPLRA